MDRPTDINPWVPCMLCNASVNIPERFAEDYFRNVQPPCPSCGEPWDWWNSILRTIRDNFMNIQAFSPIGGRWTVLQITLRPNQRTQLQFADYGIPADARILSVNYTPQGAGLFPLEIHGNAPQRHTIPSAINLYPMPMGGEARNSTPVAVLVTWVPHSADDEAWQNLVDAFESYGAGRYQSVVVPANVAVESRLSRLLAEFLREVASRENVESFLREGATYSHQLNVLLPALRSFTNAPHLPDHIRGNLNRLREFRNQMAHRGIIDPPLQRSVIAECLCAALFGFHYLNVIQPLLLDR